MPPKDHEGLKNRRRQIGSRRGGVSRPGRTSTSACSHQPTCAVLSEYPAPPRRMADRKRTFARKVRFFLKINSHTKPRRPIQIGRPRRGPAPKLGHSTTPTAADRTCRLDLAACYPPGVQGRERGSKPRRKRFFKNTRIFENSIPIQKKKEKKKEKNLAGNIPRRVSILEKSIPRRNLAGIPPKAIPCEGPRRGLPAGHPRGRKGLGTGPLWIFKEIKKERKKEREKMERIKGTNKKRIPPHKTSPEMFFESLTFSRGKKGRRRRRRRRRKINSYTKPRRRRFFKIFGILKINPHPKPRHPDQRSFGGNERQKPGTPL